MKLLQDAGTARGQTRESKQSKGCRQKAGIRGGKKKKQTSKVQEIERRVEEGTEGKSE